MNIVIIGAGDIGLHLATIFSTVEYGIVLIDKDPHKLEMAARDLDVVTKLGSGTDWELLEELLEISPDMLIALTDDDETNLVACTLAKNLGYPQTIARIRAGKYFLQSRLHIERLFSIDYLISPEKLTAEAIANMILVPEAISTESFSHGAVQMRTLKIPPYWDKGAYPLKSRAEINLPEQCMCALIKRKNESTGREEIIFPHGEDSIKPYDEVTFIGETKAMQEVHKVLGYPTEKTKSVVIMGGSLIGLNLALRLQEVGIFPLIIEKDADKSTLFSRLLPKCTIIHHDGTDYRFLQTEKICDTDVFVACTRSDEVNFLSASAAKDLGAKHVIASLSDINYIPLLNRLGISQSASPRIHAANRIFSIAREKKVASMISMYETRAEIMEVKVSMESKIAGIPIKHLGPELPRDFLIAVIQNRGRVFIADGSRILSPGDTVIVISTPKHMNDIKKLF